jgi:hypothetical protein
MNALSRRIQELSALDRTRRVFGSKTHNYSGTKESASTLGAFEHAIAVNCRAVALHELLVRIRLGEN